MLVQSTLERDPFSGHVFDFWLYTLYRRAGPLLMSAPTHGFAKSRANALGKTMLAACTVSGG